VGSTAFGRAKLHAVLSFAFISNYNKEKKMNAKVLFNEWRDVASWVLITVYNIEKILYLFNFGEGQSVVTNSSAFVLFG